VVDEQPEGTVLAQVPPAGTQVDPGGTPVIITVSSGPTVAPTDSGGTSTGQPLPGSP
jgi:beta-lactam-binding protein with PASTA domain